jgi:AraC-like DNA-binding protein
MAVRGLVAAVERAGVERAQFLADAELDARLLEADHAFLPLAAYGRVLRAALGSSGDPALGLHMAERASAGGNFDVLGPLSEHSQTLRDALHVGMRYARIVTDGPRLELHEAADRATLRIERADWQSTESRFAAEFSTVSLLRLIRRFVGDDAHARVVGFTYPAPAHRAEYTRLFGGREQFNHAFVGMELDRAWLDRTQLCYSAELRVLLRTRADMLLAKVDLDTPVAERVKRWLASQSTRARPTMEAAARELGMSARSLRRRLQAERAMFNDLVAEAMLLRAKRILADPHRSIQDAGYAIGFDTPSAFSRAFKRWTGMAPSAFRARL